MRLECTTLADFCHIVGLSFGVIFCTELGRNRCTGSLINYVFSNNLVGEVRVFCCLYFATPYSIFVLADLHSSSLGVNRSICVSVLKTAKLS